MRPRISAVLAAVLTLVVASGCGDDESPTSPPPPPETGSILVTVVDYNATIVPGATVLSSPRLEGARQTTDALGQALWTDVPVGFYTVGATRSGTGSARDIVQVEANGVYRLTLRLQPGVYFEPQVHIIQPLSFYTYSVVDSVPMRGSVSDLETASDSLSLVWSNSVDGVLSTQPADAAGNTFVPHGPYPAGNRWIVLRATNRQGLVGADSVLVHVLSFLPQLQLTEPDAGSGFLPGDPITFRATVSDRETPFAGLQVVWTSSLDGELSSGPPDAAGVSTFTRSNLTRGAHLVRVVVTDGEGNSVRDSVLVHNDLPQAVNLLPIEAQAAGLLLHWDAVNEPEFSQFRIYRGTNQNGPFSLVGTLSDGDVTQYLDQAVTLGVTYWYRVGLYTTTGAESKSTVRSGIAGVFVNVGRALEDMIVDPVRPYLYGIDRINNMLVFVSLDSLKVTKTMFIGSSPTDLDIDKAGTELYVANFGSSQIAVVNLDTQTLARNLTVDTGGTWDGNPYRLACMTAGKLAWTSLDQWNSVRLIDAATGAQLSNGFTIYYPDLASSPDGSRLYAGESGSSGSKIYRYDIVGGVLQQQDQTPGYGYGYSSRTVRVSGNGNFVFYAAKKLNALNLGGELGTFSEIIYASNFDGSVAVGNSNVFDGNTFAILRPLPIAGTLKTFGPDGHTLYTFDSVSSRLYVLDVSASSAPRNGFLGAATRASHGRR